MKTLRHVQKKILLVEDNADITHLLMPHLNDAGMHVAHANDGNDGLS
ncbi:MAG TPA: hypothetical protein VLB10_10545 [Gammaproteobacteria bacterium]|jgi:DNA-binding response OmpR family regulator|nr:hypothetical protein [Gammaproteobacteria bacterium]